MKMNIRTKNKIKLLLLASVLTVFLCACGEKEPVFSRQLFQLDNEESVRILLNEEENEYQYHMEEQENGMRIVTKEGDAILYFTFVTEEILDLRLEEVRPSVDELGELGDARYARLVSEGDVEGRLKWLLYFEHTRIGVTVQSAGQGVNDVANEILHWLSFEVVEGKEDRPDPGLEINK